MRHLLLSGGPGHEFAATSATLAALLADEGAETTTVEEPAEAVAALAAAARGEVPGWDLLTVNALRWRMDVARYAHLRDAMAVVLTDADAAVFDRYVRSGGGLLALHSAVICFDGQPRWRALLGASWDWENSTHDDVGRVEVVATGAGERHPLTAGLAPFTIVDEVYRGLDASPDLVALLTSPHGGRQHPVVWARQHGHGRVVTDLLGHGRESFAHPAHRRLLVRAARWVAGGVGEPVGTHRGEGGA